MKKYIIITAAFFAALIACSRIETPVLEQSLDQEISFQVAQKIQTKANTVYDQNVPFGTYAWYSAGSTDSTSSHNVPFMVNETIAYTGGVWKAKYNTFYWPKTGSVEFISYSPFAGLNGTAVTPLAENTPQSGNPVITSDTITYKKINTADGAIDYMYADKVIASKNVDNVTDGVNAYTGVPTIFRHALAKVSFKLRANFVHYIDSTVSGIMYVDSTVVDTVLCTNANVVPTSYPDTTFITIAHYPDTTLVTSVLINDTDPAIVDSVFIKHPEIVTSAAVPDTTYTTIVHHPDTTIIRAIHYPALPVETDYALTYWDITVTSAKISGFYTTGDCQLTLNTDSESLITPWDKPSVVSGNKKYNVWSNLSGKTDAQELVDTTAYPDGVKFYYDAVNQVDSNKVRDLCAAAGYVMPQILETGKQKLELTVHIKTHLSNGFVIDEDYHPVIDIKDISSLKAWEMNDHIVYTINIKPVAYYNSYDTPNDVTITFDPAVADWKEVEANATIQL